jgi:putative transcriptional regulator
MFCIKTIKPFKMKNNIRVERAIKNITQDELAKLIEVSRQTINAMEANKYVPSTVLSLKIAKVFDKKVEDIFSLDEND